MSAARARRLEDPEQIAVVQWASMINVGPLVPDWREVFDSPPCLADFLFHVPNGGHRSKAEAGRFRALGVKAGVSDLMLALPVGQYHGAFFEMKPNTRRPVVSAAQRQWIARANHVGFFACVCSGFDEARIAIAAYLSDSGARIEGLL